MRRFQLFTLIAVFGLSSALLADQVTLKNGDRFTGKVVKSDGKTLVLHTDAAGDITIQSVSTTDADASSRSASGGAVDVQNLSLIHI